MWPFSNPGEQKKVIKKNLGRLAKKARDDGPQQKKHPNFPIFWPTYSRVAYIYVRSRAKYLKFRTTTSKINTLKKLLMQQKYYFVHEM